MQGCIVVKTRARGLARDSESPISRLRGLRAAENLVVWERSFDFAFAWNQGIDQRVAPTQLQIYYVALNSVNSCTRVVHVLDRGSGRHCTVKPVAPLRRCSSFISCYRSLFSFLPSMGASLPISIRYETIFSRLFTLTYYVVLRKNYVTKRVGVVRPSIFTEPFGLLERRFYLRPGGKEPEVCRRSLEGSTPWHVLLHHGACSVTRRACKRGAVHCAWTSATLVAYYMCHKKAANVISVEP